MATSIFLCECHDSSTGLTTEAHLTSCDNILFLQRHPDDGPYDKYERNLCLSPLELQSLVDAVGAGKAWRFEGRRAFLFNMDEQILAEPSGDLVKIQVAMTNDAWDGQAVELQPVLLSLTTLGELLTKSLGKGFSC